MTKRAPTNFCFLDITASHENRAIIFDVVTRTAERCFMPLTVGGGVREVEDIRRLLLAGADKVSINTAAVTNRELVARAAEKFGSAMHRRGHRRQARADDRRAGRSSPMAAATRPASTRWSLPARWWRWARARSCSPPWIATARGAATTCR